jgi:DNA recombination protein RmuC
VIVDTPAYPLLLALVAGLVLGLLAAFAFGVMPARKRLELVDAELARSRVEAATASVTASAAERRIQELHVELDAVEAKCEASERVAGLANEQLAGARSTIEAMKASEADVEARVIRIAQVNMAEVRETLLTAAAERFAGDTGAFREKLRATLLPLDEKLATIGASLTTFHEERARDQERQATVLDSLSSKMTGLDDATRRVERVLGNSQARGSWGEYELQRLLEATGMTQHVSFDTQVSGYGSDAGGRPDVVLSLPGDLTVPIDSKVPFASFQEAMLASTDSEREPLLNAAVAAVRAHVRALDVRRYHETKGCVGWTLMFIPMEQMISTLFVRDRGLFEAARTSRVLITSPLTLLFYLEAFARGWAAQKQGENAEIILSEARVLVARLLTFTEKYNIVGQRLESALEAYNASVATYEGRIAPQTRRIVELRGDPDDIAPAELRRTNVRHVDASRFAALPLDFAQNVSVQPEAGQSI